MNKKDFMEMTMEDYKKHEDEFISGCEDVLEKKEIKMSSELEKILRRAVWEASWESFR